MNWRDLIPTIDWEDLKRGAARKVALELKEEFKPTVRAAARRAYLNEKGFKESQDPRFANGQLRLAVIKEELKARLANRPGPVDDWAFEAFWLGIEDGLSEIVQGMNISLGRDWVSLVEDGEHYIAVRLERYLKIQWDIEIDFDEDGKIGDSLIGGPGMDSVVGGLGAFLLVAGLLLLDGGPLRADERYQHYRPGGTYEEPLPTSSSRPIPLVREGYQHYVPPASRTSPAPASAPRGSLPPLPGLIAETWVGTEDHGLGAGGRLGDWSLVGQVGAKTAGLGAGWKRVGVNLLFDRTDEVWRWGAYAVPLRF